GSDRVSPRGDPRMRKVGPLWGCRMICTDLSGARLCPGVDGACAPFYRAAMGHSRSIVAAAALLLFGCETTPPPTMAVATGPVAPTPEVVVCPAGSSYDA